MTRAGRKRKNGNRYPSGRLARTKLETPQQRASQMPHRKAFNEDAHDMRAESLLGRLALKNLISNDQYIAGTTFRRVWGGYLATISPPRAIGVGTHAFSSCPTGGCTPDAKKCACESRKAEYENARTALRRAGTLPAYAVLHAIREPTNFPSDWITPLKAGLSHLARHFGLTKFANHSKNLSSPHSHHFPNSLRPSQRAPGK
jgi:hypothetical protein